MSGQEYMSVPEPPPQPWRFDPHFSCGEITSLSLAASLAAVSAIYGLGKRHGQADVKGDLDNEKRKNTELSVRVMLAEQRAFFAEQNGATTKEVLVVRDVGRPSTPPGSIVDVGPKPVAPAPPKRRSRKKKSRKRKES